MLVLALLLLLMVEQLLPAYRDDELVIAMLQGRHCQVHNPIHHHDGVGCGNRLLKVKSVSNLIQGLRRPDAARPAGPSAGRGQRSLYNNI